MTIAYGPIGELHFGMQVVTCVLRDPETGNVRARMRELYRTVTERAAVVFGERALHWARENLAGTPRINYYLPTGRRYAHGSFQILVEA